MNSVAHGAVHKSVTDPEGDDPYQTVTLSTNYGHLKDVGLTEPDIPVSGNVDFQQVVGKIGLGGAPEFSEGYFTATGLIEVEIVKTPVGGGPTVSEIRKFPAPGPNPQETLITGRFPSTTGPHLHFEVWAEGPDPEHPDKKIWTPRNPEEWLG